MPETIGYYSVGLTGWEIYDIENDCGEQYVIWAFAGPPKETSLHRTKVYTTSSGRSYFIVGGGRRIYFDECMRVTGV